MFCSDDSFSNSKNSLVQEMDPKGKKTCRKCFVCLPLAKCQQEDQQHPHRRYRINKTQGSGYRLFLNWCKWLMVVCWTFSFLCDFHTLSNLHEKSNCCSAVVKKQKTKQSFYSNVERKTAVKQFILSKNETKLI